VAGGVESPQQRPSGRDETEEERLDRNLSELLQELRVAQTGVQVLFAFLLVLPFTTRFTEVTGAQKGVYFATLALTAAATLLLIAPSAQHRILFRLQDKLHIVLIANYLALGGTACLALAMSGAMLLIGSFLFGTVAGIAIGAFTVVAYAAVWYAMPLERRRRVIAELERGDV
jgi:MFS family permease